jgi:hypothetical protein
MEVQMNTQAHYEVRIGNSLGIGGWFYTKQEALDHCKHLEDTTPMKWKCKGDTYNEGCGEEMFHFIVKVTIIEEVEGDDSPPSFDGLNLRESMALFINSLGDDLQEELDKIGRGV